MTPPAPIRSGRWAALVVLALTATLATMLFLVRRDGPPVAGPEIRRDQLVLRDGLLLVVATDEPFSGRVIDTYPDGSLMSRTAVAAGRLDGVSEGWHTNGARQVEEHFVAGIAHGLRVKWHPNGQKASEAPIVGGQIEGVFRRWHDNGQLAEEITLRVGTPHGPARSFHPSGFVKAEARMDDGAVAEQRFWADGEKPGGTLLADAPATSAR